MATLDVSRMTDDALKGYDDMMTECVIKVENFAPLAVSIWAEALRELERRGKVRLVSGSYDDLGNALIQRLE